MAAILTEQSWRVLSRTESWLDVVRLHLQANPYGPIRRLDCFLDDGTLVLPGIVPTNYMKQAAQELVRRIRPEQPIVNAATVANVRN